MSTEQKVALVRNRSQSYGLPAVLAALELPRSTWHYHQRQKVSYPEKYRDLREPLEAIARKHAEYGYRRTAVELREAYGRCVNRKVVQRLHQAWDLPLIRGTKLPKPSGIRRAITAAGGRINLVASRDTIGPFEVAYTDFTELVYANGRRKAYLMPLVDHATKLVLGWGVGERADTGLARQAWQRARQSLQGHGMHAKAVIVHHDQDPVFTGYAWTGQLLLKDQVRVSYALRGARDNPEMEAFNSRFKSENRSLFLDARTLASLRAVVAERMH
ncbi:MAG: DDE-type integrase/transposase/recombinase, partial [bacterium]